MKNKERETVTDQRRPRGNVTTHATWSPALDHGAQRGKAAEIQIQSGVYLITMYQRQISLF